MEVNVNDVVLPGDRVSSGNFKNLPKSSKILGPGLRLFEGQVYVSKGGVLKQNKQIFWVESQKKRYVPASDEFVIGIVTQKSGDYFKVDIGASELASLSYLSFEGATKKLRPDIKVGDALYTKVLTAKRDMEPELVCVDSHWKKGRLGLLNTNGFIFTCSLTLTQKLLSKNHPLEKMAENKKFEIAVGLNGRIWINAEPNIIKSLINTILELELLSEEDIMKNCAAIFNKNC
ncbi:exosome complex component RRP40 [Nilaparvata lugens]|uniref:exosome complex component RRP40 n=1 Tax=Nilaparvata lugens TaxID=108931 RepID=UPI00193E4EAC|nr:exosome complex component RRP40 [Nilaparvata lugens]